MKKGVYREGKWQEWQEYVEEIARRSKVSRRRRTKELYDGRQDHRQE